MESHNNMKAFTLVSILILLLVSCANNKTEKEFSFGKLVFTIPSDAEFHKSKGIDTETGKLICKGDTFFLEYGRKIYKVDESLPTILPVSEKENIEKLAGKRIGEADNVVFSQYPQSDKEEMIYAKNFYMYDTINNIIVKIVQPKKIGYGITGMYVPKLKDSASFSIYAVNLDSSTHRAALHFFKTVKYRE